jgi:ankyrin repeat protein
MYNNTSTYYFDLLSIYMQHGESGLHIAAGYGKLEVVKELYKNGANLDATDKVNIIN